jgi:hypothetical protein
VVNYLRNGRGYKEMKKIFLCFILSFASSLFALDGKWNFVNVFSQYVGEGTATLTNLSINIVRSLEFGNYEDNTFRMLRNGFVELLEPNDTYRRYPCTIFEADSSLALKVRASREITLQIFTSMDNNNQLWYSMSIAPVSLERGEISGASKTDTVFLNLMGIMRKAY